MFRALTLASLFAAVSGIASAQAPALVTLHIKITLKSSAQTLIPVPRHALLISDNPSTTSPRRVVTTPDGTVDVKLRPGSYTVESDEPVTFEGKGYQWTRTVQVTAGHDLVLDLTADNAEIGAATLSAASDALKENDPSFLLPAWQNSVVLVWTPESRASGFLVEATGLVVTSQRVIGSASAVEVQLTPTVKVAARVLVADRVRDVAVLWIDPAVTAEVRPVPLGCEHTPTPPFTDRQRLITIGAPLKGPKELSPGAVIRVAPHNNVADFRLEPGSTGGPVFGEGGTVVGLSSVADVQDQRKYSDSRIVPLDDVCESVKSAQKAMATAARPAAPHLPVESLRPFPPDALKAEVQRRVGTVSSHRLSSADFEVTFLTPVTVATQQRDTQLGNTRSPAAQLGSQPAPTDFGGWSDYFADVPSVLTIRVTPQLTESFWTTMARGAANTQGMALPPIKHFKPGFARLRAYCGDAEVVPIHPFILEQRVSETDAIREGLYVFDPDALGPQCKTVKLVLFSEKAPEKPDTRTVDPHVIERIWQDFAPYRDVRP